MHETLDARLGIVIPAYNEGRAVVRAVDAVLAAADVAGWTPDVVVVDDGSTDPTSLEALVDAASRPGVRVVHQANAGRFVARSVGLAMIDTSHVLLLDARVVVHRDSLLGVRRGVERGDEVWNYDVTPGSRDLRALFWTGITKVWWRDYFRNRTTISFGIDDFDRYPKGTGAFLAPTQLLRDAAADFDSHFADASLASDDTRLLRAVARARDINLSPEVMCTHYAKTGRRAFSRQGYFRGTTFVDGYLDDPRRARGLLGALVGAVAVGGATVVVAPRTAAVGATLGCVATGSVTRWAGGTGRESIAVGLLTPAFGLTFGAGVLRGLRMAARHSG